MIQVKRNQPSLFAEIERVMRQERPLSYFEQEQKNHGRHSLWSVWVYNAMGSSKTQEWKGLRRFIHVHKRTREKGKETHSDRLYLSDHWQSQAAFFHQGIRGHWNIENALHWVKDVIHKEDQNQIRRKYGPINASVFSSIAINIHRVHTAHSITEAQIIAMANVKKQIIALVKGLQY